MGTTATTIATVSVAYSASSGVSVTHSGVSVAYSASSTISYSAPAAAYPAAALIRPMHRPFQSFFFL